MIRTLLLASIFLCLAHSVLFSQTDEPKPPAAQNTARSSRLLPLTLRRNPQQHLSRRPRHRQQQKPPRGSYSRTEPRCG